MDKSLRKAFHAGSWYNTDGSHLNGELEGWLAKASTCHFPARAIIAPHAGYSYCGVCSAFAYKQVDPTKIKRVFILGPSHHVYMSGCGLSSATHYQTPLYDLEIDQKIYSELSGTGKFENLSRQVDEEEHSIEMHLPYVAKVMKSKQGRFTIVPVLIGAINQEREMEYGSIFSTYLEDPENLFVISSDFCHWGSLPYLYVKYLDPITYDNISNLVITGKRFRFTSFDKSKGSIYSSIEALDRTGMEYITALDPGGFKKYLEQTHNTICGRHPIAILLCAVEHLKSHRPELSFALKFVWYEQSSKCKSTSDSSVSYASASLTIS